MIKKIAIGLAVLVVVIAGAIYFLFSSLDGIVKTAIEKVGSDATQAQVSVNKVTISLSSGAGSIAGLTIRNPKGFMTPEAMALGDISVSLDIASVTGNPVTIKEIVITKPRIVYEHATSGSNLEALQNNAKAYAARFGGGGSTTAKPAEPVKASSENERKVVIENLYVREGSVGISHSALQGRTLNSPLPTIHLRDIGKAKGGASPSEVAEQVIGAISAAAQRVAVADLQKALGDAVRGAAGAAGGATTGAGDALKSFLGR